MAIKCVIFDIDNTLYSYDDAHAVAFARLTDYARERLGMTGETFRELHRRTNEALKERMGPVAAIHNRLIRYQNLLEGAGKEVGCALEMNELYWETLLDAARPTSGAAVILTVLRKRGIRIGIGTDMTARLQFVKLERLGLLHLVDFLVSSEEAGAEKPDPRIFDLCVEKAGVSAQECLFVGDSLKKDALGSVACGLRGVWFNPMGEKVPAGVHSIQHLADLLLLLD